jgi:hypothetical protein
MMHTQLGGQPLVSCNYDTHEVKFVFFRIGEGNIHNRKRRIINDSHYFVHYIVYVIE